MRRIVFLVFYSFLLCMSSLLFAMERARIGVDARESGLRVSISGLHAEVESALLQFKSHRESKNGENDPRKTFAIGNAAAKIGRAHV